MTDRTSITWAIEDQIEFGRSLLSEGVIDAEQLELAIQYAEATETSIGHALVYTGALTQKGLMKTIEGSQWSGASQS